MDIVVWGHSTYEYNLKIKHEFTLYLKELLRWDLAIISFFVGYFPKYTYIESVSQEMADRCIHECIKPW